MDWAKLDAFVNDTGHLDVAVANAVERIVIGELPGEQLESPDVVDVLADPADPGHELPAFIRLTTPQLRAGIAAAIAALDAEAAARRARKAREGRGVRCEAGQDGMASLSADLAAEAAAAVWNSLTAAAKAAKAAGDPRTMDQLRADELLARATRSSASAATSAPITEADDARRTEAAEGATADEPDAGTEPDDNSDASASAAASDGRGGCRRPRIPLAVSLTMPLSTYINLMDDPAQLDGYGPVAAGLARQMAADAARESPLTTTWRCVIVDDDHGTVLGVGRPIRTPRHDPPPRLADLVRSSEPTCCFPGCRIQARRCDLDHRIPFDQGGATCSCNLQPLCRGHHRLKTMGLIGVRVLGPQDGTGTAPGTLEWTTPTGLRYRRVPSSATPPPIPPDDPEVAAAVAHARNLGEQQTATEARSRTSRSIDDGPNATRPTTSGSAPGRISRTHAPRPRLPAPRGRPNASPWSRSCLP